VKVSFFTVARSLHAWGGALLALALFTSSVTGTLLLWKPEYLKLTSPAARARFDPTPEALAPLIGKIEAQLDPNEIVLIQLPTRDLALAKVTMLDTRYAYVDTEGNIVDEWFLNERWEEWLYDLHHRLLLGNTGLGIIGFVGATMLLLLIAGVLAFWPMRRGFRRGLWIRGLERRHLLTAHRNIGIVEALPFGLTLATGVVLAFPTQIEALFLEHVRAGQEYSDALSLGVDEISGGDSGDWLPAMQRALATFPAGEVRSVQVANDLNGYRIIGVQQPAEWHPVGLSRVYVDAAEGWMDVRYDATALPSIERAYNAVYPLHTGKLDSLTYRILLTISGLLVALLSTLGLTSFLKGKLSSRSPSSGTNRASGRTR
jgi:uncharacterized iron-regulated membrane protein